MSTRSRRTRISGVPSATITWPACSELPMPDAAAVVERHPRRAARHVEQRVEDRPVGDRVAAVLHRFGLAERRRHAAGVEVVAADDDRRRELAAWRRDR